MRLAVVALALLLPSCTKYLVENGRCIYHAPDQGAHGIHVPLAGCDPGSFEVLSRTTYARDANSVWYRQHRIPKAHSESFRVIRGRGAYNYARDRDRVFFREHEVLGADPRSFRLRQFPYASDAHRAYCGTLPLDADRPGRLQVIEGGSGTITGGSSRGPVPKGASPELTAFIEARADADFRVVHSYTGWARVGDRFFHGCSRIRGVDPATFEIVGGWYSKDARAVYYHDRKIEGADPTSFEIVEPVYLGRARDARRQYHQGRPAPAPTAR